MKICKTSIHCAVALLLAVCFMIPATAGAFGHGNFNKIRIRDKNQVIRASIVCTSKEFFHKYKYLYLHGSFDTPASCGPEKTKNRTYAGGSK